MILRTIPVLALLLSAPALAQAPAPVTAASESGPLRVETIATGLENPWGMAFLPDGRMLVTERAGRLRVMTRAGQRSEPLAGLPAILARNQGGLLDVAVDRDFAANRRVFMCFAAESPTGASTHVASARLVEDGGTARLTDATTIFRQGPAIGRGHHFGCRIVQRADGTLLVTLGDFFAQMREAQNLANTIGKVVRIAADGSIPPDNPFVGRQGADPAIWSYGHRNVQGAALAPDGTLWIAEHGARGGDEINRVEAGRNYGWPVITYALDYSGGIISNETARAGMEQPVHHWPNTVTIAPSGAAFVSGDAFPAWRGNLLVGGLRSRVLVRLVVENGRVTREERLLGDLGLRVRDVRQGPDGAIWLLTDDQNGRLLRVTRGS
jgi:glucose/arabinose dehydrogenase